MKARSLRAPCLLLLLPLLLAACNTAAERSGPEARPDTQAPAAAAETSGVDGLNVVAFDLVRADGVTAAHLEHVEARTWRVTFPGLNARTAEVSGRSLCCVTFSDFDFLGISSLDVIGPDIGGEDRVGVRAANLAGPQPGPADPG